MNFICIVLFVLSIISAVFFFYVVTLNLVEMIGIKDKKEFVKRVLMGLLMLVISVFFFFSVVGIWNFYHRV
jgi:hypothetical protein